MNIQDAPHGINLVVETPEVIYIGRFDETNGFQVLMHDCAIHRIQDADSAEAFVKTTAKYGVGVDEKDVRFDAANIQRVRILGDVEKD